MARAGRGISSRAPAADEAPAGGRGREDLALELRIGQDCAAGKTSMSWKDAIRPGPGGDTDVITVRPEDVGRHLESAHLRWRRAMCGLQY